MSTFMSHTRSLRRVVGLLGVPGSAPDWTEIQYKAVKRAFCPCAFGVKERFRFLTWPVDFHGLALGVDEPRESRAVRYPIRASWGAA